MIGLRTIVATILISLSTAGPGQAEAGLLGTFAACAGRLSAQMEHEWLLGLPSSDRTQSERDGMVGLLETVATAQTAPAALNIRIEAKHAQAELLTRATFGRDDRLAKWAALRAETAMAECRSLLLG